MKEELSQESSPVAPGGIERELDHRARLLTIRIAKLMTGQTIPDTVCAAIFEELRAVSQSQQQTIEQERDEVWKRTINDTSRAERNSPTMCNGSDQLRGLTPEQTIDVVHAHMVGVSDAIVAIVKQRAEKAEADLARLQQENQEAAELIARYVAAGDEARLSIGDLTGAIEQLRQEHQRLREERAALPAQIEQIVEATALAPMEAKLNLRDRLRAFFAQQTER